MEKSIKDRRFIPIAREILETALKLKTKDQHALLDAIAHYSLYGELPHSCKLTGTPEILWPMIKQQLDLGITKFLNGSKGGAPTGNQNARKEIRLSPEEQEGYDRFIGQREKEYAQMGIGGTTKQPNINPKTS